MYQIKQIDPAEIEVIIPFLQILDSNLKVDDLKLRLPKMIANNYACIGIYDAEKLVGISGYWLIQRYYTGEYIEPDNVVVHPEYRGKGLGELLSKWIDNYAKSLNCVAANLNVYTTNDKAIRFWLNQGYKIISFHLQKKYNK